MEEAKQPQADAEAVEPGAEEAPQAKLAEGEEAPPPRTYSEQEWSDREAAKDKEISDLRGSVSRQAMQAQIAEQQRVEADAQAKDRSDIEQGLITEQEARQRQQRRQADVAMQPAREEVARWTVAKAFEERYGVSATQLFEDQTLTEPLQMESKAKELAKTASDAAKQTASDEIDTLKARIKVLEEGGDPQFDSGQQGAGANDLNDLSPAELTERAYSPTEVQRRQKARNKK